MDSVYPGGEEIMLQVNVEYVFMDLDCEGKREAMATDISRLRKGFVSKDLKRFHCITKLKDGTNGEAWRG